MKTPKIQKKFYSLLTVLLFIPFLLEAQEISKTITKEAQISGSTTINFVNKVGDVKINSWDKNSVKLEMKVQARAKDQEDLNKLIKQMEAITFDDGPIEFDIETKFYRSYTRNDLRGSSKIKMELKDGTKIQLKEFKVELALFVPKTNPLKVEVKYNDVQMNGHNGDFTLKLYSGKFRGASFKGNTNIHLKYSKAAFESCGDAHFDLYDSELEAAATGDLNLKSKYSKLMLRKTGHVRMESFDDKIDLYELSSLKGSSKYTNFELGDFAKGDLYLYDCDVEGGKIEELFLKSKYTSLNLRSVNNFQWNECYDNKLTAYYIGKLNTTSKYTTFDIETLGFSFSLSGYDDNVDIDKIEKDFSGFTYEGKYTNFDLNFEEGSEFLIDFDSKYTTLDYEESSFDEIRYHKDNSQFNFKAVTKGSNADEVPVVKFKGYNGKLVIRK